MSLIQRITALIRRTPGDASDSPPVLTRRRAQGNAAEDHALKLLRRRGDKLVTRNWLCRQGEIDLITWHRDTLVFTEVRSRSSHNFGTPAESVNSAKQERMRRAAHWYLAKHYGDGHLPSCRYDVVWVDTREGQIIDAGIIEGAFC